MIIKNNFCNIFLWGACEAVPFKNLQHLHEAAPTTSPPGAEVAATLCVLGESGRTWTERGLDLCLYVSLPSPQCLSKSQLSFVRGHALAWHIPFSAWLSDGWERTPCMAHRCLETSSFFSTQGGIEGGGIKWTVEWTEILAKLSKSLWNVGEIPRYSVYSAPKQNDDARLHKVEGIDLSPLVSARRCT